MKRFLFINYFLLIAISFGSEVSDAQSQPTNHFDPIYFHQQVFAHRGGYHSGPENSISTILHNIGKGVKAVEVDVMMTQDSQLILFHDYNTKRLLNSTADLVVSETPLAELQKHPLRDTSMGTQYVQTLKELVDTLIKVIPKNETIAFLLELDFKPNGNQKKAAVHELISVLNQYKDSTLYSIYNYFFVSSYYPDVLGMIKKANPNIKTGLATINNPSSSKVTARLAIWFAPILVKKHKIDIIEPNLCQVNRRYVKRWKRRKRLIISYTANSSCEKDNIIVHNITYTTDCPTGTCDPEINEGIGKPKRWCKKCR